MEYMYIVINDDDGEWDIEKAFVKYDNAVKYAIETKGENWYYYCQIKKLEIE